MGRSRAEAAMEQPKKPDKPKSLSLTVKTLEKKSAPRAMATNGACPVIGYS
jgi:hypothetical protein